MRIKLQCECGQRFAFEVEPINGRMPSPVECPACGADSTAAANAAIAQVSEPQSAAAPAGSESLRITIPAHERSPVTLAAPATTVSQRPPRPLPGQTGRANAKVEARAKISWGDPPIQVLAYLRSQGYGKEESSAIVEELVRERVSTIRGKGILSLIGGTVLSGVSVWTFLIFRNGGWVSPRTLGIMILLGLYGIWLLINGVLKVMAPKSTPGDVED